jgi:hypothetical protein
MEVMFRIGGHLVGTDVGNLISFRSLSEMAVGSAEFLALGMRQTT